MVLNSRRLASTSGDPPVEAGVPEQYQQLIDGRLDAGIDRAALAPSGGASHLFHRDRLGVAVFRHYGLDYRPVTGGGRRLARR
ncbi:hypothetical protein [Actinomadura geliboluensis]|uniref:hypothetical protein n=1 Tax=Actinomadura geliboluensis TaxID=882440 RepID=UPI00371B8735